MGTNIHAFAERETEQGFDVIKSMRPFDDRNYGVFEFLADVGSCTNCGPISGPRGLPADASYRVREEYLSWGDDAHTPSWLTVDELMRFDYDTPFDCDALDTYRDFLGEKFFDDLAALKAAGATRVVFWFDS